MGIKKIKDIDTPSTTDNLDGISKLYNLQPDPLKAPATHSVEKIVKENVTSIDNLDKTLKSELDVLSTIKQSQATIVNPLLKNAKGLKTIVTYYNQKVDKSTDMVTRNAPSQINNTKYNKIKNFIIFMDSPTGNSLSIDEGIDNVQENSAVIGPGSILPYPNDFFYMNMYGKKFLFRVSNVEPLTIHKDTGFRIEFEKHNEQFTEEDMDRLCDGFFVFQFENVGTGNRTILKEEINKLYKKIQNLMTLMSEKYCALYYDKNRNFIRLEYIPSRDELNKNFRYTIPNFQFNPSIVLEVVDPYLHKFISNNFSILNLKQKNYPIVPLYPLKTTINFELNYRKTIFYALERRMANELELKYQMPLLFNTNRTREIIYNNIYTVEYTSTFGRDDIVSFIPIVLQNNIINKKLYNYSYSDQKDLKYNMIIKYIIDNKYIPTEEDINLLDNIIDEWEYEQFMYIIPFFMYILGKLLEIITVKDY